MVEQEAFQVAEYIFVKKFQAIDVLFTFITSFSEEKCRWWATVINVLIIFCKKQKS